MEQQEKDMSWCPECKDLKPRIFIGKFPNGKDKKYVNDEGKQWVGRKCPDCVRDKARKHAATKRAEKKSSQQAPPEAE